MRSRAMAGTQSPAELDVGDLRRMGSLVRVVTMARPLGSKDRVEWARQLSQSPVFDSMQEPDALNAQVRICAGGAG